ncbi:glycine cleavage H-protein-domain-containing protein [Polychytrium aggregatum]|uniref:glycine cleavage H-protein-domain-containing protein n=1 Tax=Polychytrium aggregatum TaxID=110093 RepID=UPI0022FE1833|nr:glycine cleavage H-protein-domain-containing protein [Polychytrium aggregatum]KAI9204864.1 glycine cleavage H-protein-domain-containing protein [Polychytrium aggregatum]
MLARVFARSALRASAFAPRAFRAFPSMSMAVRTYATRKYTKDHEWISVENGVGTIGVTNYAQEALGDVVFVETPEVGKALSIKDQIGAIESVKAASDVYSPVSGEVVEANEALNDEPSLINSSPFGNGWIAKVKLSNPEELDSLLDEAAYAEHISG